MFMFTVRFLTHSSVKHCKNLMAAAGVMQNLYNELEANYPIEVWSGFASKYLYVPIVGSIVYVILIHLGKKMMEERPPFKLRKALFLWNVTLAIFSIIGTINVVPRHIRNLTQDRDGFYSSVCFSLFVTSPWLGFWIVLFTLSKLVEFGDTFFVVLRKTPLNFLHWYHHITVLLYSWYATIGLASRDSSVGLWFCAMNFIVHSVMYTYYAIKATGTRVPSSVSKFVTILQLSQFFVGLVVTLASSWYKVQGYECNMSWIMIVLSFAIHGSYMILFANFFYHRYIKRTAPKERKKE